MTQTIGAIDVIVPLAPVVSVASVGVQGPPGEPGEPGPAGPPGPQGEPGAGAGPHAATHYVGGADALAGSLAATDVRVGVNPAQTGAVRLANNQSITARDAANGSDIPMLSVNAAGQVVLGSLAGAYSVTIPSQLAILPGAAIKTFVPVEFVEITTPGAPAANGAFLYVDNNTVKRRLMVRFGTGAAVQIAIEP